MCDVGNSVKYSNWHVWCKSISVAFISRAKCVCGRSLWVIGPEGAGGQFPPAWPSASIQNKKSLHRNSAVVRQKPRELPRIRQTTKSANLSATLFVWVSCRTRRKKNGGLQNAIRRARAYFLPLFCVDAYDFVETTKAQYFIICLSKNWKIDLYTL